MTVPEAGTSLTPVLMVGSKLQAGPGPPTMAAATTETETETLLGILGSLKEKGVTCIYISHRLREVTRIADRITVLRDGKTIVTDEKAAMPEERMIRNMVGRDLAQLFPRRERTRGEKVLEVRGWTVRDPVTGDLKVSDFSFEAHRGEMSATSEVGKGSVFRFTLPVAEDA